MPKNTKDRFGLSILVCVGSWLVAILALSLWVNVDTKSAMKYTIQHGYETIAEWGDPLFVGTFFLATVGTFLLWGVLELIARFSFRPKTRRRRVRMYR